MGYAFISYSTQNQSVADSIRELFNKNSIDTWMAPYDIPIGSKYAAVITSAIRDCACFVLLLSKDSQASEAVDKEVELAAIQYKKTTIVLKLEDIILNDSFTYYIHNQQIIAVNKVNEDSQDIKQVISSVKIYTDSQNAIYDSVSIDDNSSKSARKDIDMFFDQYNVALECLKKGKQSEQIERFIEAIKIYESLKLVDKEELFNEAAFTYGFLGKHYKSERNYDEAEINLLKAIELYEALCKIDSEKNSNDLAVSYENLSIIYTRTQQLTKAIACQTKAAKSFKKVEDNYPNDITIAQTYHSYINLIALYKKQKKCCNVFKYSIKAAIYSLFKVSYKNEYAPTHSIKDSVAHRLQSEDFKF